MKQLSLFQLEPETDFGRYHDQNPQVYRAFKEFSFKAIAKGHKHYGAQAIFEVIRFHTGVSADGDAFKINNNFAAYYARMFMRDYPQYNEFFRIRKSEADNYFSQLTHK